MLNKFREHRRDLGLTQIELAQITNIPRHRLQLAENGHPFLHSFEAGILSKIFGYCDLPEFLQALVAKEEPAQDV